MRAQRRAHHIECIAIAVLFGVKARQHLQRLDLGFVAAPERGQRLEVADHLVALEIAEAVAQRDFAQLPLRRRRAIRRLGRRAESFERILVLAETMRQAAGQHQDRRLHVARHADGLEFMQLVGRAGEIAHLDRRAHRLFQRQLLQLDRQGRDRGLHILEA